jgi:hypothetical protein
LSKYLILTFSGGLYESLPVPLRLSDVQLVDAPATVVLAPDPYPLLYDVVLTIDPEGNLAYGRVPTDIADALIPEAAAVVITLPFSAGTVTLKFVPVAGASSITDPPPDDMSLIGIILS